MKIELRSYQRLPYDDGNAYS